MSKCDGCDMGFGSISLIKDENGKNIIITKSCKDKGMCNKHTTLDKSIGHSLKILPKYFNAIKSGSKTFEVRKNDRGFEVGDKLILKEWNNGKYTGRGTKKEITYILDDNSGYVLEGYVIMGIK